MQKFCGVLIDPSRPIKNGKIVSAIRNRLARLLDIKQLQRVLYDRWQPQLHDKDLCMTDATCYESHLRFPTIYANNDNRTYCTTNSIVTNFVRKGPKPKDEDKTVAMLSEANAEVDRLTRIFAGG
ncbi:MAG: hypothetical protein IJU62_07605 [Muribaculaceae bacterium]|nr:hypothetical protein [Muribaculaceae bacterium]